MASIVITDEIHEWVRRNWFDVVASGEVKHYKAGTRVDQLHSRQGAFSYASKKMNGGSGGARTRPNRQLFLRKNHANHSQ
jgi:hypothetical protein